MGTTLLKEDNVAWVTMTNNTGYQYNNAPADPGVATFNTRSRRLLWLKQTSGVRTEENGHEVYTNVRKVTTPVNTIDIGEMSKTWWDGRT